MIRYQITGTNPIEMNTAGKILIEHPRLQIDSDSGNRNGRKEGYIRYVHCRIKHSTPARKSRPKVRLDGAAKMSLARRCWDRIVYKTDGDEEALQAIIELIEHVERKCS
jgi:hypothetical protein